MDLVGHLRRDAAALLDAAARDLDADVPGCPGWTTAHLVFHVGRIHHRWRHVADDGIRELAEVKALERPAEPPRERLIAWAREQAGKLVDALERLDPEAPRWNFTRGPQVGAFIPRRMAHETSVHRWDAESATGSALPLPPELAADGVDEFLTVFATRGDYDGPEGLLGLYAEDVDRSWTVQLAPPHPTVVGARRDPGDVLAASAATLVLWLWGRVTIDETGPLAAALREHVAGI